MRSFLFLFFILVISCQGCSHSQKSIPVSGESNSGNQPQPDTSFKDFIFQFDYDPDFQKSRIKFPLKYINSGRSSSITENSWNHERLFFELEAITDISNGTKVNAESNERVFSWIKTKYGISKNFYFKKGDGLWYLSKIEIRKDSADAGKEDFYSFLTKFCTDSVFQKERIHSPLEMIYLDDDYNEVNEIRTQDQWTFTGFYYDCDSVSMIYYDFQRTFKNTDLRILSVDGTENGINSRYTFKRIDGKWVMTRYEDYST